MHKTSFMASEKSALRQSKEYTNVRRDTQHTHTRTRTTRLKRPQFGVSVHILKLLSSDLRHVLGLTPSRKQTDSRSEHSNFLHIFIAQPRALPGDVFKLNMKVRQCTNASTFHNSREYPLHTLAFVDSNQRKRY